MQKKERLDALGTGLLLYTSSIMGLNQALIKLVNAGFAPVFQSGLRSACAFLPVLLFALVARRRLSLSDGSLGPGLLAGLLFSGEFCLLFLALEYTTVARASVLFYTMPLWVALGAHWLIPGERLTRVRLLGLALAIAGVALAFAGRGLGGGDMVLVGDLMCLLAAVLWAGIALLARTTRLSRATPEMQLLYQLAVSGIVLLALAPLFGELVRDPTPAILAVFAFQVLVVVGFSFVLWFWVLSVYPASDMASFGFLSPVFGVFFGWLLFDEALSASLLGALCLVGAGIVLVNRRGPAG